VDALGGNRSFTFVEGPNGFTRMHSVGKGFYEDSIASIIEYN